MSQVVSIRLQDHQMARLQRYARALGKTPGEASALMVEERLRENDFALIEFRPSPVGRQAYMKGSRLGVWWVVHTAKQYQMDVDRTAKHFERPEAWVKAALNYYEAYPEEIDQSIADHQACDFESLKRALPQARLFLVNLEEAE